MNVRIVFVRENTIISNVEVPVTYFVVVKRKYFLVLFIYILYNL
jgi:hypothetical protein